MIGEAYSLHGVEDLTPAPAPALSAVASTTGAALLSNYQPRDSLFSSSSTQLHARG